MANIGHRLHFIKGEGKKDWDSFFAAAQYDEPIWNIIELVRNLWPHNNIVVVSGRPERTRLDTLAWLLKSKVPCDALYMREDGDHRPDHEVKEEILDHILTKWDVLCSIDDRNQVVAMWRRRGITCLQVRDGDY